MKNGNRMAFFSNRCFQLQINGVEVVAMSHEEAAILLKTAPTRVDLVLVYSPVGAFYLYNTMLE